MKILNVVGARPNFMKIAPIVEQMKKTADLKRPEYWDGHAAGRIVRVIREFRG